ncbi:hypothetical protein H5410_012484, partial [Solanum commersonii]
MTSFLRAKLVNWLNLAKTRKHVGLINELSRACRTTQRFAESPYFGSVTFGEKLEVVEGSWQLVESLLDRPLSAPLNLFCTVTFCGLILARRMLSAI